MPVMVSGSMRTVLRASDFFLISLALGGSAVAGLELGFQYYFIGFGLTLGLSSGTISLVSPFVGAGEPENANFTVEDSFWIALMISVPLALVTWGFAEEMVGLLTDDPATIQLGGTYLRIVMILVLFRFWSMIAAQVSQMAGDTRTPMYVRLVTIPINLGLNAVLIFGVGPFPSSRSCRRSVGHDDREHARRVRVRGHLAPGGVFRAFSAGRPSVGQRDSARDCSRGLSVEWNATDPYARSLSGFCSSLRTWGRRSWRRTQSPGE